MVGRVNLVKSIRMFEWVCNAHNEVHIQNGISEIVGLETHTVFLITFVIILLFPCVALECVLVFIRECRITYWDVLQPCVAAH